MLPAGIGHCKGVVSQAGLRAAGLHTVHAGHAGQQLQVGGCRSAAHRRLQPLKER